MMVEEILRNLFNYAHNAREAQEYYKNLPEDISGNIRADYREAMVNEEKKLDDYLKFLATFIKP